MPDLDLEALLGDGMDVSCELRGDLAESGLNALSRLADGRRQSRLVRAFRGATAQGTILRNEIYALGEQLGLTNKQGLKPSSTVLARGQGMTEYLIVVALVAVAAIGESSGLIEGNGRQVLIQLYGVAVTLVWSGVLTFVILKVIDCPNPESGRATIDGVAKDGIQVKVKARVTVRTKLSSLVGGATEETIIARVGEGIVKAIGSAEHHTDVLANPNLKPEVAETWTAGFVLQPDWFPIGDFRMTADWYNIEITDAMPAGKIASEIFEKLCEDELVQPTFVCDFPTDVSPLSKQKIDDPDTVERFEMYAGGFEVCNGFSELNDPVEQRRRFEDQLKDRAAGDAVLHHADQSRATAHADPRPRCLHLRIEHGTPGDPGSAQGACTTWRPCGTHQRSA